MEHTSDIVYEGKLIHETSYTQRSDKYQEVQIGNIKIDYYDPKNKIIHEVKKSNKIETAHHWQLKYYMYVLEQSGIKGIKGILEYPKLRKTEEIILSKRDISEIENIKNTIFKIINSETAPKIEKKTRCKNCSYYDFCYINEE